MKKRLRLTADIAFISGALIVLVLVALSDEIRQRITSQ